MESNAYRRIETPAFAVPSPVELPERRAERQLDRVPDWVLPIVYQEIEIDLNPIEVAVEHGIDSELVAVLCKRGYLRVATAPLPTSTCGAVRRLWDTLEAVDSRVIRQFPNYDRETYFRDKTAWQAVFYEHLRRQIPRYTKD